MPQSIGALRAIVFAAATAAASAVPAAAGDAVTATRAAHDPLLIGRPSQDTPDACAALPLEWRLRCSGGPAHDVHDIGAPDALRDEPAMQRAAHHQPEWLHQAGSAAAPCNSAAPVDSPQ